MAEKIIKNPSLLPGDLEIELSGGSIIAISGHPLIGSGGGTQSDYVYYPVFDDTTGNVEFHLGTTASNPQPAGGWHISGADGARGPQGVPGDNGKTPTFQIDPENAHWEWKYTDDEYWTDTHVVASGAVGPQGDPGDNGISPTVSTSVIEGGNRVTFTYGAGSSTYIDVMSGTPGVKGADGISPTVSTETIAGGNRVTFTYDTPSKTKYIDVMSGAPGAPGASGASGYSPTVTTSEISPTTQHPQGGTSVTITDYVGAHQFDIWNGLNGEGATVNLIEGTGIKIIEDGTDYTIGVSGGNIPALSAGYAQSASIAQSATSAHKAFYNSKEHLIGKELEELNTFRTDIFTWTDVIAGDQGVEVLDLDEDGYPETFQLTNATYSAISSISNKLDISAAAATYQPKGNYATTSDISDMATETWVGQQGYLTSVPDSYATKTYANDASANALSEAKTWVGDQDYLIQSDLAGYATEAYAEAASANAYDKAVAQIPSVANFITKDVNNLTYYYNKTDSDLRYMQKNTDSTLSGDGTTNTPLGIDTTDAYTIDGTNGITAVPDATSNKVIVQLTNDVYQDVQHVHTSATVWDTVSAKSNTDITSAGMVTVTNTSGTTVNGVVQYAPTSNRAIPRVLLCANEDSWAEIVGNVLPAASGMGCLIFVLEPH